MSSGTPSAPGHALPPGKDVSNAASWHSGADQERKKSEPAAPLYVVLTGNPNCGKTTLFNALTGLRAKVGNYAGVTVERKEGRLIESPADLKVRVLDLP